MTKEFRYTVLDNSLFIEEALSKLLFFQFRILKEKTKTLSHNSSALSFKNKVDLLFDLDRITKESYDDLILFMEIRNQFIHNNSVSNILIAVDNIKKKNRLLTFLKKSEVKYEDLPDGIYIELLEAAFIVLTQKILDAINYASDSISKEINEEVEYKVNAKSSELLTDFISILSESIDAVSDKFDIAFGEVPEHKKGLLRNAIIKLFTKKVSEKYKNDTLIKS